MNMVAIEKNKPIISKTILKKFKTEVETKTLEIDINLRWGFNIYRYNIIDDIKWILVNIFFKDLIEIEQYQKKLRQYIKSVDKRKANKIKNTIVKKKLIYRSYMKLEWH